MKTLIYLSLLLALAHTAIISISTVITSPPNYRNLLALRYG